MKASKLLPIYKKVSTQEISILKDKFSLSNIDKNLEQLMYCTLLWSGQFFTLILVVQKYLSNYVLIHLTDKIRSRIDRSNYAFEFFGEIRLLYTKRKTKYYRIIQGYSS